MGYVEGAYSDNGKDVDETCNFKDFLDGIADIGKGHGTLILHDLLGRKQNSQTCGGKIFKVGEIEMEFIDTGKRGFDYFFQLWCCSGVESTTEGDVES